MTEYIDKELFRSNLETDCYGRTDIVKIGRAMDKAKVQLWIPVTERLPDKTGFYIVRTNKGTITTARFNIDPVYLKEGIFPNNRHPTHWMPLPEIPVEVDNESN